MQKGFLGHRRGGEEIARGGGEREGREELFDHGSGQKRNKMRNFKAWGPNPPQVNFCFLKR